MVAAPPALVQSAGHGLYLPAHRKPADDADPTARCLQAFTSDASRPHGAMSEIATIEPSWAGDSPLAFGFGSRPHDVATAAASAHHLSIAIIQREAAPRYARKVRRRRIIRRLDVGLRRPRDEVLRPFDPYRRREERQRWNHERSLDRGRRRKASTPGPRPGKRMQRVLRHMLDVAALLSDQQAARCRSPWPVMDGAVYAVHDGPRARPSTEANASSLASRRWMCERGGILKGVEDPLLDGSRSVEDVLNAVGAYLGEVRQTADPGCRCLCPSLEQFAGARHDG